MFQPVPHSFIPLDTHSVLQLVPSDSGYEPVHDWVLVALRCRLINPRFNKNKCCLFFSPQSELPDNSTVC